MINEKGIDESADGITYQFYVDASQLLFPGSKVNLFSSHVYEQTNSNIFYASGNKTRVLAQLYTQSSSDMEEKTGWKYGIFNGNTDEFENHRDSIVQQDSSSVSSLLSYAKLGDQS